MPAPRSLPIALAIALVAVAHGQTPTSLPGADAKVREGGGVMAAIPGAGRDLPAASAGGADRALHRGRLTAAGAVATRRRLLLSRARRKPIPDPPPSTPSQGVRSDVPYIQCAVCEALAGKAEAVASDLRARATPAAPFTEGALIDALERLTQPTADEGEWIASIDLVEDGKRLRVVEMGALGVCGQECKTAAMAAAAVLDAVDTDLAEELWRVREGRGRDGGGRARPFEPTPTLPPSPELAHRPRPRELAVPHRDRGVRGAAAAPAGGAPRRPTV